jgi:hypothetical protein
MDAKIVSIFVILLLVLIAQTGNAWDVDFSRRQIPGSNQKVTDSDASSNPEKDSLVVKSVHKDRNAKDRQEFVILNTNHGFIPSQVRLHKGLHYKVNVVNVNEDKKNVSFIMDGFNQHYATYFGQIKTFDIDPDKEGVYEFECPETTAMGKVVVFGPGKNMAPAPTQTQDPIEVERNVSSEP